MGVPPVFPGFPDTVTGLVVLTHPLTGYYTRRDGRVGSYTVWHEPLTPSGGRVRAARWDLLDRLGIVPFDEQTATHSVLVQPRTEFIVRLPPRRVDALDWIPVRPKNYRRVPDLDREPARSAQKCASSS
jgi:hypothetical protein